MLVDEGTLDVELVDEVELVEELVLPFSNEESAPTRPPSDCGENVSSCVRTDIYGIEIDEPTRR